MNNLKNIAGNDVAIFLFRYVVTGKGISFVMNEAIAQDMYADVEKKLQPLAYTCSETLSRYKHLSVSTTIMDGNILDTGEFEVMLSRGLGRHIPDQEKQNLFQDAKRIADLLTEVMDRRTKEEKDGKQPELSPVQYPQTPRNITKELEQLGNAKSLQSELQWIIEGKRVRPGLKRLHPSDLPPGVIASRGYDHRGHCYLFTHKTLGEIGRIVLISMPDGRSMLQAELFTGQEPLDAPIVQKRKKVFEKIVTIVNNRFDENFPE